MNFFEQFHSEIQETLLKNTEFLGFPTSLDLAKLTLEPPKDLSHGDMSTNAALILAKQVGLPSIEVAKKILPLFGELFPKGSELVIAGPGFINIRLPLVFWQEHLKLIITQKEKYTPTQFGKGKKVHIEFVSANPTGPMHTGHSRNAILGDALASTLEAVGYDVHREHYTNDAGGQINILAKSLYLRYLQHCGRDIPESAFEGLYPGDYLVDLAKKLKDLKGDAWIDQDESVWIDEMRPFAVAEIMTSTERDLRDLGIIMDTYTSEAALVKAQKVDAAFKILEERGDIYHGVLEPPKGIVVEDFEPREQSLFRATKYGDTVDRPLKKSDGSWSYFAPDIAYHLDKYERGFEDMIIVLSADHKGYFTRLRAAVDAVTGGKASIQIRDYEMVNFMENGVPVKMSKRSGAFITLRDLLDRVGKDVLRFIMLTRHHSMVLDFDFAKVLEHSKDNPVFYVHYAHARICSVMRHAHELFGNLEGDIEKADLSSLTDEAELALIKILAQYPRYVELAASHREPHRIAYYLYEVASHFHSLWNKGKEHAKLRFIDEKNKTATFARLGLLYATALIIRQGLAIFKIDALEEMR